jgi:hypothetical protein
MHAGHFPWLIKMLWGIFSYTEMGKAMDRVTKMARDLIKARRENGHTEKVSVNVIFSIMPWVYM